MKLYKEDAEPKKTTVKKVTVTPTPKPYYQLAAESAKPASVPKYNNPELAQAATTTKAVASQQAQMGQQALAASKVQPQVFSNQFAPQIAMAKPALSVQPQVFANQFTPQTPYQAPRLTGGPVRTTGGYSAPTFANEYMAPIPYNQLQPAGGANGVLGAAAGGMYGTSRPLGSPYQSSWGNTWAAQNPWNTYNPYGQMNPWTAAPTGRTGSVFGAEPTRYPTYTTLPADIHQTSSGTKVVPHARWEQPRSGNLWSPSDIAADVNPSTGFTTSQPVRRPTGGYYTPSYTGGQDWYGNPTNGYNQPQWVNAMARWNID